MPTRTPWPGSTPTPTAAGPQGCAASCAPAPPARTACWISRATTTSACPPTPGSSKGRSRPPAPGGRARPALGWSPALPHCTRELEAELAAFVGAPDALVFSSGYLANLGVVTALSGPGALVVSDAANHASLVDACRLARARIAVTPRDDPAAVDALLAARTEERALVVTDSVNSVDGAFAPLRELHAVCRARGALLVVDEAHGLGVVGPGGRGLLAEHGLAGADDIVVTVTLSKALGSQGGAVRRIGRGDRAPGRHRPLVHLRHRPRARPASAPRSPPCGCCAPNRSGRPRSSAPPRPSPQRRRCPRRRRPWCRWCSASPTSPSPPRPRAPSAGCGWAASGRRRCRRAPAGSG